MTEACWKYKIIQCGEKFAQWRQLNFAVYW